MRTFEIKERKVVKNSRPIVLGKDKSSNQSIILCPVATLNRVVMRAYPFGKPVFLSMLVGCKK